MAPRRADYGDITDDQQDGGQNRPKQEPSLNRQVGSITHPGKKGCHGVGQIVLAKTAVIAEHLAHHVDRRNPSSKSIEEPLFPSSLLCEIFLHGVMASVSQTHYGHQ